jgi:hypothetical protein
MKILLIIRLRAYTIYEMLPIEISHGTMFSKDVITLVFLVEEYYHYLKTPWFNVRCESIYAGMNLVNLNYFQIIFDLLLSLSTYYATCCLYNIWLLMFLCLSFPTNLCFSLVSPLHCDSLYANFHICSPIFTFLMYICIRVLKYL